MCPNRTHFFTLFGHQILQEGHELVLARRGQAVIAHHQVRLRRAFPVGIFLAQQFAGGYSKILGKELNLLNRRDTSSAFHFVYQVYASAAFTARNRRPHAFCHTEFFDILHKNLFVQRKYHLFCNCGDLQNNPIAELYY